MMETYHGYVRTPADAIKLFEACRLGLLPRVQRRLSEKERQSIRSGSVFVWDEREAGMRRWTDGKSWSASRVSGSFLTYREMEGKRGGGFPSGRRGAGKTPDSSGRGSDEDQDDGEPDGYRYKADGLMKQSFSITTSTGQHLHLISYYARPHPGQPDLPHPSTDPSLRHIVPVKGMYPESSLNEAPMPAMTRAPMQQPPYAPPPQHPPQGYPQQYAQYGAWPPSPVATPPYSHYTVAPPYATAQLPPPTGQYPPHPQQYMPGPPPHPAYDRPQLPPPGVAPPPRATPPSMPAYSHPAHHSPHLSHPRAPPTESPRSHHLQAQAAAVMIDPRLAATSARNPQGPLPALGSGTATPPPRTISQSPPGSSHSNGAPGTAAASARASLSALLHPTPANSEPNSANAGSNSANSSPRTATLSSANGGSGAASNGLNKRGPFNEDAKALDMLNKKFCL